MHLMRTIKFSSLPFFAKGKKNSFVSYPNKFNNKFIDTLKRGGHDPILGKMGKIRLGSTRERACYISVICPIQFRFHPRVLLFHTSDENGPEGELEWEIQSAGCRLRSALAQMKFKAFPFPRETCSRSRSSRYERSGKASDFTGYHHRLWTLSVS